MQRKDLYEWILIAAVVIGVIVFIYLQNSSSPSGPIDVRLQINPNYTLSAIYPFQGVSVPVEVFNLGKSYVKGLDVGIFINGNLSSAYNVSIPAGQSVTISLNQQFKNPGTFSVSFIADPSNLYTLQNRSNATLQFQIRVNKAQTPAPYSTLPANYTWQKESYMGSEGYLGYSYFKGYYRLGGFDLSSMPAMNSFFEPFLNLTYSYINGIYSSEATYRNASAYSLWIQGSLSSNITDVWAAGANLPTTNKTLNGQNILVVLLNKNTTLCSWYSGGWLKNLGYEGNRSCISALSGTLANSTPTTGFLPSINGSKLLANFSEYSVLGHGYGKLVLANTSLIYEASIPNTNPDYLCYGPITLQDNRSYCTTYLFPSSNSVGSLSLINTRSFIGQQNLSVLALVNTSLVPYESSSNIALLSKFNQSGATRAFSEGINSTCSLNSSLSCYNPSIFNGNLTLSFHNKLNYSFGIRSMYCVQAGKPKYSKLNATVPALANLTVALPCYDNGNIIKGIPLGLTLKLGMNYTASGKNFSAFGNAYVV